MVRAVSKNTSWGTFRRRMPNTAASSFSTVVSTFVTIRRCSTFKRSWSVKPTWFLRYVNGSRPSWAGAVVAKHRSSVDTRIPCET